MAVAASEVIVDAIAASFRSWRDGRLQLALSQADSGERVDGLVIYMLTDLREVAPDAANEIKAARGIPDPVSLLDMR